MSGLITYLIIGILAGWLGGIVMKGRGLGIWGDIIVGIIGAIIGGYIFRILGIATAGFFSTLVSAIIGSIILLALISLVRREESI